MMIATYSNYGATFSPETAEKIVQEAQRKLSKSLENDDDENNKDNNNSNNDRQKQQEKKEKVMTIKRQDIQLGRKLGCGSFGIVYEITFINKQITKESIDDHEDDDDDDDDEKNGLVLKTLSPVLLKDPQKFIQGAADFVMEGKILAKLNHPNILSLKGWSHADGVAAYRSGRHDAFHLVLERIQCTLTDKLHHWSEEAKAHSLVACCLTNATQRKNKSLSERSKVVLDLAEAIRYIHSKRIIHRDLKPDNIGFSSEEKGGVLKVFDFDSSRILPAYDDADTTFKLTQGVGSLRYMSPECATGKPYNCKCDVYSFGLIVHEILTLEQPYHNLHKKCQMSEQVFGGGGGGIGGRRRSSLLLRPAIPHHSSWPIGLGHFLQQCWSENICHRPTMEETMPILHKHMVELMLSVTTTANHHHHHHHHDAEENSHQDSCCERLSSSSIHTLSLSSSQWIRSWMAPHHRVGVSDDIKN